MQSITYSNTGTSTGLCPRLPMHHRHSPITFTDASGATGATAYPVNFDELYNLKGRLLTLIDATFTDPEQRKAFKDMAWMTLRAWMEDIQSSGRGAPAVGSDDSGE